MDTKTMRSELRTKYEKKLDEKFILNGREMNFREQINKGNGSELKPRTKDGKEIGAKFWSPVSSSRLCFELYSWIVKNEDCADFSFEKSLDGIKSGNSCTKSFMDVYVRTKNNDVWFIESKFTEKPKNISELPCAYYQTLNENGEKVVTDNFDAETYYRHSDGKKLVKHSLMYRFSGHHKVIKPFIDFVNSIKELSKTKSSVWFDTKQETCHLLGIIMFILNNDDLKGHKVHFRNIVYNKKGDKSYIKNDELAKEFIIEGAKMVSEIIPKSIEFDYQALSVQDLVSKHGKEISFIEDNKMVEQRLKENFEGYF